MRHYLINDASPLFFYLCCKSQAMQGLADVVISLIALRV